MRRGIKRPKMKADEHPRPQVMVPMSVFGDILFSSDYARVGRFLHHWCYAVWKKDPTYRVFQEDDTEQVLAIALATGYAVEDPKFGHRFTGPSKDPNWLLDKRKTWTTYAIEAVGQDRVKIGKTTDLERRLDELQVASPHDLRVVTTWNRDIESRLHRQIHGHRVGGEWFEYNDEVRAILAETK